MELRERRGVEPEKKRNVEFQVGYGRVHLKIDDPGCRKVSRGGREGPASHAQGGKRKSGATVTMPPLKTRTPVGRKASRGGGNTVGDGRYTAGATVLSQGAMGA